MTDRSDAHDDDSPSLRQRLHAATGDRQKEAEALAERSDDDVDVDVDDAEVAVRRAHGDIDQEYETNPEGRAVANRLARPGDAEHAHEEHQH